MKVKLRLLSVLLLLCMVFTMLPFSAAAAETDATTVSLEMQIATKLKTLGLFKGVSDTDFALDKTLSRTEALVMLIRMLGKEKETLDGDWEHPFTDVAEWADAYVGYAYGHNLTKGVSATEFGTGEANALVYITFILRALGYSDENGKDFTWDNPYELALRIGVLPDCVNTKTFLRADAAYISYAALSARLKGSFTTLANKLIDAYIFTEQTFQAEYDKLALRKNNTKKIDADKLFDACVPAVFTIIALDEALDPICTGSGFFIDADGTAVTNFHVIEDAFCAMVVMSDGETYEYVMGIYDYSEKEDWAVIKVFGEGYPYLTIGDPATVYGGAAVYAVGSPMGLQTNMTAGTIANPNQDVYVEGNLGSYILNTAPISPGSSGGALVNEYGEVVGITTAAIETAQNMNFSAPISVIANASLSGYIPMNRAEFAEGLLTTEKLEIVVEKGATFSVEIDCNTEEYLAYFYESADPSAVDFITYIAYNLSDEELEELLAILEEQDLPEQGEEDDEEKIVLYLIALELGESEIRVSIDGVHFIIIKIIVVEELEAANRDEAAA